MKKAEIGLLVVVVLLGSCWLLGVLSEGVSIEELLEHFEQSGLTVEEPPAATDPKGKEELENISRKFRVLRFLSGSGRPEIIRKSKLVDSVRVFIYRYRDPHKALAAYERGIHSPTCLIDCAIEKETLWVHGRFVLKVPHYDVERGKDGRLRPISIEIDPADLAPIEAALRSFPLGWRLSRLTDRD